MGRKGRYRFGCFEVSLESRTLTRGGSHIELSFRSFEALRVLIEAGGAVVDRDELHKQLWPDVTVDETSLNKCISELRRTLAEHDPGTEYVETVRRRGYRIAVPVEGLEPQVSASPSDRSSLRPGTRKIAFGAVCLVLALGAAYAGWTNHSRRQQVAALRAEGQRLSSERDYPRAAAALKRALALAPSEGPIYSELAHVVHKMRDPTVDATQSIELAQKGVDLAPDCGECQGTLGFFLFYHGWQWDRAKTHYREALRLAPESVGIRPSYAFLLAATGQTGEALEQAKIAAEAQPLNPGAHSCLAQVLYVNRLFEKAIAAANRALALDPKRKEAWEYRSRSELALGRLEDGVRTMLAERYKDHAATVGEAVDRGGPAAGLRKLVELTGGWPERSTVSWRRAVWLAVLGEDDAALEALEEAVRIRNINLMFVAVDPLYTRLHREPRFQGVLDSMGLSLPPAAPPPFQPTLGQSRPKP